MQSDDFPALPVAAPSASGAITRSARTIRLRSRIFGTLMMKLPYGTVVEPIFEARKRHKAG